MRNLFKLLKQVIEDGEDAVLVTIIASCGSTPRGSGAHMIVTKRGRIYGTIGGGAVEYQCENTAQDVLKEKSSRIMQYILNKNQIQDLGMICGGDVQVFFRYLSLNQKFIVDFCDQVEKMFVNSNQCFIIDEITDNTNYALRLYDKINGVYGADIPEEVIKELKNDSNVIEFNERKFYCEKLIRTGMVYIFGGGHVAQALVPILSTVDFRCTVLEDREDFCKKELFKGVEDTILINNNHVNDYITINENNFVVIMTRGHKDDQLILKQVLKTPAKYIGVIGSKHKSAIVFDNLRKLGFTEEDLKRVTTPIGLDIMGKTPSEIAISITAQLINTRAKM